MQVETSSGLVANVTFLKGADLRELRRRTQEKGFHPMTYALQKCVEIVSPGIYKEVSDYNRLLTGDRLVLYLAIREATKGSKFNFQLRCPQPRCGSPIRWTLDLHDLDVKPLPPERKKALVNKNEFTETLDGYGEVKVKYTDGYDELNLIADSTKHDEFTAMVLSQIISVGDHSGPKAVLRLLDEESADLTDKLLGICRRYEFGPETSIEVACNNPRCQAVSTVPLPTDLRFFFDEIGRSSSE